MLDYAAQFPDPTTHSGELKFVKDDLEKLTKSVPTNGEIYYHLGRACILLHDTPNAIANLRRAHEISPQKEDFTQMLAVAYKNAGDSQAGLPVIRELIAQKPSSLSYDLLGQLLLLSNEPNKEQQAQTAFEKSVQLQPGNYRTMERLGTAYQKARKFEEARSTFEQVARLNPNRTFAFQQLAAIYNNLKILKPPPP
jgi:tetratricopeptide (TPR) repeat protein